MCINCVREFFVRDMICLRLEMLPSLNRSPILASSAELAVFRFMLLALWSLVAAVEASLGRSLKIELRFYIKRDSYSVSWFEKY